MNDNDNDNDNNFRSAKYLFDKLTYILYYMLSIYT